MSKRSGQESPRRDQFVHPKMSGSPSSARFAHGLSVTILLIFGWSCTPATGQTDNAPKVVVSVRDGSDRVDVTVDGKPFTSYRYASAIPGVKKPILYPVFAPSGVLVTRGYPLDPVPGERADHPHQIGSWFNHGDVNDFDFWNNSNAVDPADSLHFGYIRHREIVEVSSGSGQGSLAIVADWLSPLGATILEERTRFLFEAAPESWIIDRTTTLTALDDSVVFEDSKEGMMAIRVARALEQVTDRADPFVTNDGSLSEPVVNNGGATGRYFNSEGSEGDDVWGQRAAWTALTGQIERDTVTIAILDHPSNVNYPTQWMARAYGLFAANPFGSRAYTDGVEHLDYLLAPGQSVTLRYRILIDSGPPPTSAWINAQQASFASSNE